MTRNNSRPPKKKNTRCKSTQTRNTPVRKTQFNAVVQEKFVPYFSEGKPHHRYLTEGRCVIQSPDGWLAYKVRLTNQKSANRSLYLQPGDKIVLIEAHHPDRYGNEQHRPELHDPSKYHKLRGRQNFENLTRRQKKKGNFNRSGMILAKGFLDIEKDESYPSRIIPIQELKHLVQDPEIFFKECSRRKSGSRSQFPTM